MGGAVWWDGVVCDGVVCGVVGVGGEWVGGGWWVGGWGGGWVECVCLCVGGCVVVVGVWWW